MAKRAVVFFHCCSSSGSPGFSVEELQELLENEDRVIMFISDLPQVQQISRDRAQLTEANEKAASKWCKLHCRKRIC